MAEGPPGPRPSPSRTPGLSRAQGPGVSRAQSLGVSRAQSLGVSRAQGLCVSRAQGLGISLVEGRLQPPSAEVSSPPEGVPWPRGDDAPAMARSIRKPVSSAD